MSSATKRVSSESRKGRGRLFQTRPGPATVEDRSPTLGLCDYRIQTTSTGGTNGRTITACTLICILFLRSKLKKQYCQHVQRGRDNLSIPCIRLYVTSTTYNFIVVQLYKVIIQFLRQFSGTQYNTVTLQCIETYGLQTFIYAVIYCLVMVCV